MSIFTKKEPTHAETNVAETKKSNDQTLNLLVSKHIETHRKFWGSPVENAAAWGNEGGELFAAGMATLNYLLTIVAIEHGKVVTATDIEFLSLFNPNVTPEQCGAGFNNAEWVDYFVPALPYTIGSAGVVTIK